MKTKEIVKKFNRKHIQKLIAGFGEVETLKEEAERKQAEGEDDYKYQKEREEMFIK